MAISIQSSVHAAEVALCCAILLLRNEREFQTTLILNSNVFEIRTLVRYYATSIGNYILTFWDNLSNSSSRVKNVGQIGC
jgi:hypothetical protein